MLLSDGWNMDMSFSILSGNRRFYSLIIFHSLLIILLLKKLNCILVVLKSNIDF